MENGGAASGNPVEGGFSTTSPEIYPEALVENPPGKTAGSEAYADKGGRPTVLDDNAKTLVCTLLSVGLSRRQAAAYAVVSHTTIGYAIAHDETFAARVERAEQMAIIKPLLTIANLSRGSFKAAAWLLERNERRRKPTQEELREAEEERTRSEQEAHEGEEGWNTQRCSAEPVARPRQARSGAGRRHSTSGPLVATMDS